MKIQVFELQGKDPRTLSPIIDRIVLAHEKNQQRQMKAQHTNHSFVVEYQKYKNQYESKAKQRQSEMVKKMSENRRIKSNQFKKQSQHIGKVLEKYEKEAKARENQKLQAIHKRILNITKKQKQRERQEIGEMDERNSAYPIFSLTQNMHVQSRCMSNSLDLESFQMNKYNKIYQLSEQIRKKSEEKQKKADQNRRNIKQKSSIRELNSTKILRKLKADQQFSQKEHEMIKKSIIKLQLCERRSSEQTSAQRQKSLQQKQKQTKLLQKLQKKHSTFQHQLSQKLSSIQHEYIQKQNHHKQNKQNLVRTMIQNKISKRLQKCQVISNNYQCERQQFNTKMEDLYKRDREHWGFLTSVGKFKEVLIEKNVYENSQLALLK